MQYQGPSNHVPRQEEEEAEADEELNSSTSIQQDMFSCCTCVVQFFCPASGKMQPRDEAGTNEIPNLVFRLEQISNCIPCPLLVANSHTPTTWIFSSFHLKPPGNSIPNTSLPEDSILILHILMPLALQNYCAFDAFGKVISVRGFISINSDKFI